MAQSHSDVSPLSSPAQPSQPFPAATTPTSALLPTVSLDSTPGHTTVAAPGPIDQSHADPDSVDPLDAGIQTPPPQAQDPVVSLQPGHHVTVLPANKQSVNSAIVVTAASINSAADASQQQQTPPSTALPQQPHKRSFYRVLRAWIWELFACVFAILMVGVEVFLLAIFDGRNVETWHHSWQINSVFAFVTALLEAAVAFAVTACLGQLRWLWFQKGNQELRWMDKLTNARAAPGALTFVFSQGAWRHWATLGAALIVALLGTSVFTQEIIVQKTGTYNVDPTTDDCSVPISNNYYNNWQYGDQSGDEQPYIQMISAINSGFMQPASNGNADNVVNLVDCDTGNCTFAEYTSLAICSKCADISDTVVIPCNTTECSSSQRIHLPDDSLSLDTMNGYVNITSDTVYPDASVLSDIGPLIARYRGLGSVSFPQTQPNATECAIYWCVQTYNAEVLASSFIENISATWTNLTSSARTSYGDGNDIVLTPDHCYVNGTLYTVQNNTGDCVFGVDALSQRALQNYLVGDTNSTGFLTGGVESVDATATDASTRWLSSTLAANTLIAPCSGYENDCTSDFYGPFNSTIANMTYYMTNNLRKTTDTGPGYSYGTMSDSETHFHARWGWLAYPIAIVLISLLFVIVTIIKSKNHDPWKSSVVALMFHGFQDADRGTYTKLDDPAEMVKATRSWSVSLLDMNGTRTFVRSGSAEDEKLGPVREVLGRGVSHGGLATIQAFGGSGAS
ncbi:hypothetical protein LTR36_009558 [Oleoguttula mirabilis]|uniref:Uncharacterized protein n=1 Tax=Oleoguttula mirabilis TaxID=1507867 RepID=A0AAV9JSK3_9PEZI|nr:hypothetical protein LTR36_009558 [Oleoguttula mirabilis]